MAAASNAGGLDSWEPDNFKYLSPTAFHFLAQLLMAIEAGAPWPTDTTQARAAFLSKTGKPSDDPLEHRVLLILAVCYRRWANLRLRDVQDWVLSWIPDSMFAGAPGRGADDAWFSTGVWAELRRIEGTPFGGFAVDIYKCFDQVQRPLLTTLLGLGGFPPSPPHCLLLLHGFTDCSQLSSRRSRHSIPATMRHPSGMPAVHDFLVFPPSPLVHSYSTVRWHPPIGCRRYERMDLWSSPRI